MKAVLASFCFVAILCVSGCGANPLAPDADLNSKTKTLTWEFVNSANTRVDLRFFDQANGAWYPSRSEVYGLEPGENHTYRLECNKGASICYGATVRMDRNRFWGRSVDGNQSCGSQGCCHACDGSTLTPISLSR
jgi:hypothetical protein